MSLTATDRARGLSGVLERLARFTHERPGLVIGLCLLAAVLAAAFAFSRLELQSGRDQLISPDKPYFKRYMDFKARFRTEEFLIAVLDVEDPVRARDAANCLAEILEASIGSDIRAVYHTNGLEPYGLLYASEEDYRRFLKFGRAVGDLANCRGLVDVMEHLDQLLVSATPGDFREEDIDFLQGLFGALASTLEGSDEPLVLVPESTRAERILANHFRSRPDGKFVYVYIVPTKRTDRLVQSQAALEIVRGAIARTKARFPGQAIGLTGRPAIDSDEMATSSADMTRATILAFAGVAILFLVVFRTPLHCATALAALAIAIAWTFGVITVWPGRLNILSTVFAVILVGLGIDFGIYLLKRYDAERARGTLSREALVVTLAHAGRATFLGALTTALAFGTILFADFRGLVELGFIAACGILLAWLAMVVFVPAGISWIEARRGPGRHDDFEATPPSRWRFRLGKTNAIAILLVSGVATALSIPLVGSVSFDTNPADLQAQGVESVEYEKKLVEQSKRSTWFGVSIVARGDLAALEERARAFEALPEVGAVDSILVALPSSQDARLLELAALAQELPLPRAGTPPAIDPRPLLATLGRIRETLLEIAASLIMRTDAADARAKVERAAESVEESMARIAAGSARRCERFESLLFAEIDRLVAEIRTRASRGRLDISTLPPFFRELFIGSDGSFCLYVHPEDDPNRPEVLDRYVRACVAIDPEFTGAPIQFHHISRQLRSEFGVLSLAALGVITLTLVLTLRRAIDVVLALVPLLLGLVWLAALMVLLGISFNLANFFAVPILVGIGVDVGIHFVLRAREGAAIDDLWHEILTAVLTATITSMIGFGSLLIAHHRGVASLGWVMVLGLVTCLVASLLTLPALLRILEIRAAWSRVAGESRHLPNCSQ